MNRLAAMIRPVLLTLGVLTGMLMMNAGQALAEAGCEIVPTLDFETDETIECAMCTQDNGTCSFICDDGQSGDCTPG